MRELGRRRHLVVFAIALVFACALVGVFQLTVSPSIASADEIEDLQAQADAAKVQLDEIKAQSEVVTAEYQQAQDARDAATMAMTASKQTMKDCEARIEALQTSLSARAAAMYRSGTNSMLTILLESDSFMDLLNTWDMLNNLSEQDASNIAQIKVLKDESKEAQKEYSAQEKELNKQLKVVEQKKTEVDAQVTAFQSTYDSLSAEVAALVTAAYQAEQDAKKGDGTHSPTDHYGEGGGVYGAAASLALSLVGSQYVSGGSGPSSFDCSGFVQYCLMNACGVYVPHYTEAMYSSASEIIYDVSQAQYGDVLYMPGHVGFALGNGSTVEAEWEETGVCVRDGKASRYTCILRF